MITRRCGGAYGCKISRNDFAACATALVAKKLNKPCRMSMRMPDIMRVIGKRPNSRLDYEVKYLIYLCCFFVVVESRLNGVDPMFQNNCNCQYYFISFDIHTLQVLLIIIYASSTIFLLSRCSGRYVRSNDYCDIIRLAWMKMDKYNI